MRLATAGRSSDGRPVMAGADAFRLVDSEGIPLSVLTDGLRTRGAAFDVCGFVAAAKASGNFTRARLSAMMTEAECYEGDDRDGWLRAVEAAIAREYGT